MRLVRLFAVVLTILTSGLLLSTPAGAQPASRLTDHITDSTGVLTDSGRAAVSSAIDRLSNDRHIQLWVVYVDNFNRFKPENWAGQTRSATGMGDHDAVLAIATNTKLYTFTGPPKAQGITADELNNISRKIESAITAKDWSGAAVAAADGLNASASAPRPAWLPIAIGVAVAVVVLLVLFLFFRARRRRRAARRIDAGGQASGDALSTADARVRQISDYVAKYQRAIGAEAKSRFEDAKRQLAAAHGSNASDAIAHANWASTLAAQAQTLANADVLAAHRTPGRRGTASAR